MAATAADKGQSWFLDSTSKTHAEDKLAAGGNAEGSFCLRPRGDGHDGEFVMSVVYKSRPTHHLVAPRNGKWTVNKRNYGAPTTLTELVELLQTPGTPGWPVPLASSGAPSTAAPAAAPVPVSAPTPAPVPVAVPTPAPAPTVVTRQAPAPVVVAAPAAVAPESAPVVPAQQPAPVFSQPLARAPAPVSQEPASPIETANMAAQQAEQQAREAKAKAVAAQAEVERQKRELAELQARKASKMVLGGSTSSSSSDGGYMRVGARSTGSGSGDSDLTKSLARAVIKLGTRVTDLESQLQETREALQQMQQLAAVLQAERQSSRTGASY
eukprot:m.129638 g.129638  ORF g.129638 m.129638 type:complete len:326 (+) comp16765_c0_seq3:340-1317(+)